MGRRRVSAKAEMAAVLEGLRGGTGIADICRRYGIAEVWIISECLDFRGALQNSPPVFLMTKGGEPCIFNQGFLQSQDFYLSSLSTFGRYTAIMHHRSGV